MCMVASFLLLLSFTLTLSLSLSLLPLSLSPSLFVSLTGSDASRRCARKVRKTRRMMKVISSKQTRGVVVEGRRAATQQASRRPFEEEKWAAMERHSSK